MHCLCWAPIRRPLIKREATGAGAGDGGGTVVELGADVEGPDLLVLEGADIHRCFEKKSVRYDSQFSLPPRDAIKISNLYCYFQLILRLIGQYQLLT